MKRRRGSRDDSVDGIHAALSVHGERFMSMFDDEQRPTGKQGGAARPPAAAAAAAAVAGGGADSSSAPGASSDSSEDTPQTHSSDSEGQVDSPGASKQHQQKQQHQHQQATKGGSIHARPKGGSGSTPLTLEEFLGPSKGSAVARRAHKQQQQQQQQQRAQAARPRQEQLEAERQQQRLVERQLRKQFMSSKASKIFEAVDASQLAAAAAATGGEELLPADFAAMRRDVEQLGASGLDKASAKAHKASQLARLGAAAEKRPRIPARMGLGLAKKAKQRAAAALQEAIAAGMVKAKGRGKKARAEKAKQRDRGLMEAGPGFKNGVLRLPRSSLQ